MSKLDAVSGVARIAAHAAESSAKCLEDCGSIVKVGKSVAPVKFGKGDYVETVTAAGEKIAGELLGVRKTEAGIVGTIGLPETGLLAKRAPVGDITALSDTGTIWRDSTGAVFRSEKSATGFVQPEHLKFAEGLFAPLQNNLRLVRDVVPASTEVSASAKNIAANIGNSDAVLTALGAAPKLEFTSSFLHPSKFALFNPKGAVENCMPCTAALVRTLGTGQLVTADQVAKLTVNGERVGASYAGRFSDEIDALKWFRNAAGVETPARVSALTEMNAGRIYAMDVKIGQTAAREQHHMVFAAKTKNGNPFVYDPQSGFQWHLDSMSRNKLSLTLHELKGKF